MCHIGQTLEVGFQTAAHDPNKKTGLPRRVASLRDEDFRVVLDNKGYAAARSAVSIIPLSSAGQKATNKLNPTRGFLQEWNFGAVRAEEWHLPPLAEKRLYKSHHR